MAMPTASMREYAFGLVKASFHRLHHLLSALSQAIPPCFERKTEPLPSLNSLYTPFGSPVPGGQKPQRGTNGRCSTLVEESNGVQAAVNDR